MPNCKRIFKYSRKILKCLCCNRKIRRRTRWTRFCNEKCRCKFKGKVETYLNQNKKLVEYKKLNAEKRWGKHGLKYILENKERQTAYKTGSREVCSSHKRDNREAQGHSQDRI